MLALKGVPGIYIHSLLGSRNYYRGVEDSGIKRMINRETLSQDVIDSIVSDAHSLRNQVLDSFLQLLNDRKQLPSFHPSGTREVLLKDKRLLTIVRQYKGESICVVINVSDDKLILPRYQGKCDLITNTIFNGKVNPYGVYFLR